MVRYPPTDFHVFCDESHTEHRFMVYGGIVIPSRDTAKFDAEVNAWRARSNMTGELKWTKVTDQRLPKYRSLLDLYFANVRRDGPHFKAAVFDMSQVNYKKYHRGDKELGFYKFYYQFLLHKFGQYAKTEQHKLYIYLDERSTKYKLSELRKILNNGIKKKHGHPIDVVFTLRPLGSKKSNVMQIADVLVGAVGWTINGKDGDQKSKACACGAHRTKSARRVAQSGRPRQHAVHPLAGRLVQG